VEVGRWADADAVKASVKGMLRERFGIIHSTLELECSRHSCTEASNCASKQKD
jgi:cobalt-zinc-cadmium efflux system protein